MLSLLISVPLLRSQQPTFSTDVKVVNVLATVRDKKGQIVRNLTKDDFTLEENGQPQAIRYFAQETNLPLTIGLLVDTSPSQRRLLDEERSASYKFLDQVLRQDKDLAFLIHFDAEVELLQDLTSSRKQLESALGLLHPSDAEQYGGGSAPGPRPRRGNRAGGTAVYDAIYLASDEIMKKQQGRKALVLLSDGIDNASKISLEQAIEAAQRADTLVYSILFYDQQAYDSNPTSGGRRPRMGGGWPGGGGGGTWPGGGGRWPGGGTGYPGGGGNWPGGGGPGGDPGGGQRYPRPIPHADGKKILERISRETGARLFEVSKKQSVDQIYAGIQEELRNQYNLGYTPDRAEGGAGYRKIRLVAKQKDLIVQAREGYYAER